VTTDRTMRQSMSIVCAVMLFIYSLLICSNILISATLAFEELLDDILAPEVAYIPRLLYPARSGRRQATKFGWKNKGTSPNAYTLTLAGYVAIRAAAIADGVENMQRFKSFQ
jgi:hypothetical protein